jgi:hypothetical protein
MATRTFLPRVLVVLTLFGLLTFAIQQPGWAGLSQIRDQAPVAPKEEPSLWATPLDLDFGVVGIGETSDPQLVTITNNGEATLANFSSPALPNPFHSQNNCASGVLPDMDCQFSFWVAPTTAGIFTTTATITTNAGPFTIMLRTRVIGAELSATPLFLDFGSVLATPTTKLEITADQQIVVVRNTGVANLSGFSGGEVSPPFEVNDNCPASLPPGDECEYFYNFFPSEAGTYTETSKVTTNAGNFTVKLKGEGEADNLFDGQRATPLELDFGPVGVGTTSDPQYVTITNLSISHPITNFMNGELDAPFELSENCGSVLAPGGSCQQTLTFSPTNNVNYTIFYTTTTSSGTFTVTLHGQGIGASLHVTPLVLDFGPVLTGTTSAPQSVMIKNTGTATLTGITGGGINPPFEGSQDCGDSLPAGETCQYTFYYKPTSYGYYTGTSKTETAIGSFKIHLIGGIKPPETKKEFIPDRIPPGGVSTLQISIKNPNPAATLFDVEVNDNFPAGLVIASPLTYTLSPGCGTPTFLPVVGKNSFSLSDGTILGNQACTLRLNVTAPTINIYTNTIDSVIARYAVGEPVTGTLFVGYYNYLPYTPK